MTSSTRTRRALLASFVGASAATVVSAISRVSGVAAATGGTVMLGARNTTAGETRVSRTDSGPALTGTGAGPGIGVAGTSDGGIGIQGVSDTGKGVVGSSLHGSGVEAASKLGIALRVRRGRFRLDGVSGTARMAKGDSVVLVSPTVEIARDAFVLLTPMARLDGRDLWFTRQPGGKEFAIRVDRPVAEDTFIGWLMLG